MLDMLTLPRADPSHHPHPQQQQRIHSDSSVQRHLFAGGPSLADGLVKPVAVKRRPSSSSVSSSSSAVRKSTASQRSASPMRAVPPPSSSSRSKDHRRRHLTASIDSATRYDDDWLSRRTRSVTSDTSSTTSSTRSNKAENNEKYMLSFSDHEQKLDSWSVRGWDARDIDSAVSRSSRYANYMFKAQPESQVHFLASSANMTCRLTYQQDRHAVPKMNLRAMIWPCD